MTAPRTEAPVRSTRRYGFTIDLLTLAIALILALRVTMNLLFAWHAARMERRATAWCRTFGRLVLR